MNVFTTDHPMWAQRSCLAPKQNTLLSFWWSTLVVALVFCPVFLGLIWFATIDADSPDVPGPSWTDPIFNIAGFIIGFPAFLLAQAHESLLTKVGFTETGFFYVGVVVDCLFWALASVTVYRLLAWHFQKKRSSHGMSWP